MCTAYNGATMTHEEMRRLVLALDSPAEAGPAGCDSAELATPIDVLGPEAVAWAVDLARRGFELTSHALSETERQQIPALELRRAIERSTLDLLRILSGEHLPYELNRHQVAVVREMVRQEVPFERIVRGLRRVERYWRDALLNRIERHPQPPERAALLCRVVDVVSGFTDAHVDAVIAEHLFEQQRLMAQRLTDRREMVSSIIAGEQVTEELAQRTLGARLNQHHVAFVVWHAESHGVPSAAQTVGAHADLERVASRAADNLRCPGLVTVPKDDATVWAWAGRTEAFPTDYPEAFEVVHDEPHTIRAAVGVPAYGLSGFRRSHLAARDAHRIATSVKSALAEQPIVAYRDIDLVAMLSTDIERACWFVGEELGALAADDPVAADLRSTLLCYFDCGSNLVTTAARLHRHRNTVVHRLRKIEKLLGHPISERAQRTHAAVTLAARVGSPVLEA